ncbi:MAG TPA: hypothetical protein VF867_15505 [Arthrobacter sp.]
MEFFIGPPVATEQVRKTTHYLEVITPVQGAGSVVYYINEVHDDTWAACACWGRSGLAFDMIFSVVEHPEKAPKIAAGLRDSYPSLFLAYDNAMSEQYGAGALAQFIDPDDMNRKWFVASMFRAHDVASFDEKMPAAANRAILLSCQISMEFETAAAETQEVTRVAAQANGITAGDVRAAVGALTRGLDWLDILMNQ